MLGTAWSAKALESRQVSSQEEEHAGLKIWPLTEHFTSEKAMFCDFRQIFIGYKDFSWLVRFLAWNTSTVMFFFSEWYFFKKGVSWLLSTFLVSLIMILWISSSIVITTTSTSELYRYVIWIEREQYLIQTQEHVKFKNLFLHIRTLLNASLLKNVVMPFMILTLSLLRTARRAR